MVHGVLWNIHIYFILFYVYKKIYTTSFYRRGGLVVKGSICIRDIRVQFPVGSDQIVKSGFDSFTDKRSAWPAWCVSLTGPRR